MGKSIDESHEGVCVLGHHMDSSSHDIGNMNLHVAVVH